MCAPALAELSTRIVSLTLSLLDLAAIGPSESVADSFAGSVALAQLAERTGYRRVWYAEHHSIKSIASAATSVLIAHIAAHTKTIRLGAGGVMLPNHSPLTIAEQFGTLAELHPGRIDLGLGRAPGGDRAVLHAMRRDVTSSDRFYDDVLELQAFLGDKSRVPGVRAIPGQSTHVPLYILGSSLFGAELAAKLGLPYAFASHFAPAALFEAIDVYRQRFTPSKVLERPYVIAGVNVVAAPSDAEAMRELEGVRRIFLRNLIQRGDAELPEMDDAALLRTPHAAYVEQMFTYRAVGQPDRVLRYLEEFQAQTQADELITVHHTTSVETRLRSVELLAQVAGL
jgi:luciferase family oxidoreductase group 1